MKECLGMVELSMIGGRISGSEVTLPSIIGITH